jgi:hypothetical protein
MAHRPSDRPPVSGANREAILDAVDRRATRLVRSATQRLYSRMNPIEWIIPPLMRRGGPAMTTTMPQTSLQLVMADEDVAQTLTHVATMIGLPRETVARIVEAGLPMMASVADEDPYVFKAMFAQSRKGLPQPTPELYTKLGKNPVARQALATDFKTMYGATTDALNREAARRADASEAQAGQVLAATMPAVVKAVGVQNVRNNEMGFGRQLRKLNG